MPRLFVSVRPPREVLDALAERLAPWPDLVRGRERWHFTLRFLGERSAADVADRLATLASEPAFTARIGGAGTFGSGRRPRVLWIGVAEGRRGFERLAAALADALGLESQGHVAHLTLRRLTARAAREVVETIGSEPIGSTWTVDEVLLETSSFPRQPVEYRTVARVRLRAKSSGRSVVNGERPPS